MALSRMNASVSPKESRMAPTDGRSERGMEKECERAWKQETVWSAIHSDTFIKILMFCPNEDIFFFDFFKKTEQNADIGEIPSVYYCKKKALKEVTAWIIRFKVSHQYSYPCEI